MALSQSFVGSTWVDGRDRSLAAGRVDLLDSLRGLAALVVVFMHGREVLWVGMGNYLREQPLGVTPASLLALATAPLMYGAIGVSLLFVLSGYVIHRSVARHLERAGFALDAAAFYQRRAVRIYPTLLLALMVTAGCDAMTRAFGGHALLGDSRLWALVSNVFALQGVTANPYGSNTPLWSLAIEIQFYLVYPFALMIRQRVGMDAMLAIAIVVSLLGGTLLEPLGITAFPQYYLAWWAGAYLADCQQAGRRLPRQWPWFAAVFLMTGCAAYTFRHCTLGIVLWGVGLAPVLAALLERDVLQLSKSAFLRALGRFSYSLYAVHFPILVLASAVFCGGLRQPDIVLTAQITFAAIVICYGAYWLAEYPSVRLLETMRK
jgi:peptidoglycan/LPS O-acetylase OafA/YrhL